MVAVKLDGTRTERISHLHSIKLDGIYESESHGVPSPDGLRISWASHWDKSDDLDWENGEYLMQAYIADYRD